jgi:hypothetical protein
VAICSWSQLKILERVAGRNYPAAAAKALIFD